MSGFNQVKDAGFRTVRALHLALLNASRGRVLKSAFGMPVVELRTIGRKSGKPRVTVLTSPIMSDDRLVLVASKGGDDRHPDWLLNLQSNPEVEITVGAETRRMRARVAGASEKAELWPQVVKAYRGYAGYQRRTKRDIPLVICEPSTA